MHFLLRSRLPLIAFAAALAALFGAGAAPARAADDDYETTQLKLQATYIWQQHPAFRSDVPAVLNSSAYSGGNPLYSLTNGRDKTYTGSVTLYAGWRPWGGGELYFVPEAAVGVPLTGNLIGLGTFYNGEITRAAGPNPTLYRQRLFLRQTWNQGGGVEHLDSDFNWMAGNVDQNRIVLTAGNFSTLDVFDHNRYASDPRRQFMNWGNMTYAAYDYAADARGWGWGAAVEWYRDNWVVRAGRMTGPQSPNGLPLDFNLRRHYGDQVELERDYVLGERPGAARVLFWRNKTVLASYADAIAYGNRQNWQPDQNGNGMEYINDVRTGEKIKYGVGLNLEQELADHVGAFFRGMKADGKTETEAFAEVDASLAAGVVFDGDRWGRHQDTVGISLLSNYLSKQRRTYLQQGGISFFIGDGWLNYKPEQVFEAYYRLGVCKGLSITADLQQYWHPAYNADRGPVRIGSIRLHAEFQ